MSDEDTAPRSLIGEGQIFPDAQQAEEICGYANSLQTRLSEVFRKKALESHKGSDQGGLSGLGNAVAFLMTGTFYRMTKSISPEAPKRESGNPW